MTLEPEQEAPYRLRLDTVEFHNCLLANRHLTVELEELHRENARLRLRIAELEQQK